MGKVKLTRKQADAIESAKNKYGKDKFLYDYSRMLHEISPAKYTGSLDPVNDLALHQVAKALYIGYEIEETIEVGDWLTHKITGRVVKVTGKSEVQIYVKYEDGKTTRTWTWTYGESRHSTPEEIATEKERRRWVKNNRKVWELKEGDILKRISDNEFVYVIGVKHEFTAISIINDYESEEYTKKGLREEFSVLYLSEDRKDVEHE